MGSVPKMFSGNWYWSFLLFYLFLPEKHTKVIDNTYILSMHGVIFFSVFGWNTLRSTLLTTKSKEQRTNKDISNKIKRYLSHDFNIPPPTFFLFVGFAFGGSKYNCIQIVFLIFTYGFFMGLMRLISLCTFPFRLS